MYANISAAADFAQALAILAKKNSYKVLSDGNLDVSFFGKRQLGDVLHRIFGKEEQGGVLVMSNMFGTKVIIHPGTYDADTVQLLLKDLYSSKYPNDIKSIRALEFEPKYNIFGRMVGC